MVYFSAIIPGRAVVCACGYDLTNNFFEGCKLKQPYQRLSYVLYR